MSRNNYERECGWRNSIPAVERKIPEYNSKLDVYCGVIRAREYKKKLQRVKRRRNKIADALSNALFRASKHDDVSFVSPFAKGNPQMLISDSLSRPTSSLDSVGGQYRVKHSDDVSKEIKLQEMQALKKILIREGYIRRLKQSSKLVLKRANSSKKLENDPKAMIIDLLVDVREASLNVVESIISWRYAHLTGFNTNETELTSAMQRSFIWNGMNYLVKMSTDMNFLAKVHPLVDALGVPPTILMRNPFAYPHNLDNCPPLPEHWKPIPPKTFLRHSNDEEEMKDIFEQRIQNAERTIISEIAKIRQEIDLGQSSNFKRKRKKKRRLKHSKSTPGKIMGRMTGIVDEFGKPRKPLVLEKGWLKKAKAQMKELKTDLWKAAWPHNSSTGRGKQRLEPLSSFTASIYESEKEIPSSFGTSFPQIIQTYSPKLPKQYIFNRSMESVNSKRAPPKEGDYTSSSILSSKNFTTLSKHISRKVQQDVAKRDTCIWAKELQKLDASNIEELAAMDHPSPLICVVAASIMVLLSPGNSLPADLSWNAVRNEFVNSEAFIHILKNFDGANIPEFKIRALHPFITQNGFNPQFLSEEKTRTSKIAALLCAIVLKIVRSQPEYLEWLGAKDTEAIIKNLDDPGKIISIEDNSEFTSDVLDNYEYDDEEAFDNDSDYSNQFEDAAAAYEDDFETVMDNRSKQLLNNAFGDGNDEEENERYDDENFEKESRPNTQRQKSRAGRQAQDEFPAMGEDGEFDNKEIVNDDKEDKRLEESFQQDPNTETKNIILTSQQTFNGKECFVSMFFASGSKGDRIMIKIYDVQSSMEQRRSLYQDDIENLLSDGPYKRFLTSDSGSLQSLCSVILNMIYLNPDTGDIEFEKGFAKKEAALKIQCMTRRRAARRSVRKVRKEKIAPVKIQTHWRMRQSKKRVDDIRKQKISATKIQSLQRQRKSKKRADSIRRSQTYSLRSQATDIGALILHQGVHVGNKPFLLSYHVHRSTSDIQKGVFVVLNPVDGDKKYTTHISFGELFAIMKKTEVTVPLAKYGSSQWPDFLKLFTEYLSFIEDRNGYVHITVKSFAYASYLEDIDRATTAAMKVQAHARRRVAQIYKDPKRINAATDIQRIVRGKHSQKIVETKIKKRDSAICIQNLHRQKAAKRQVQQRRMNRDMMKRQISERVKPKRRSQMNAYFWEVPLEGTQISLSSEVMFQPYSGDTEGLIIIVNSAFKSHSKKRGENTAKLLNALGLGEYATLTRLQFLRNLQRSDIRKQFPPETLAFHFQNIFCPRKYKEVFDIVTMSEGYPVVTMDGFATYYASMATLVKQQFKCVLIRSELTAMLRSQNISISGLDQVFDSSKGNKLNKSIIVAVLESLCLSRDLHGEFVLSCDTFKQAARRPTVNESHKEWFEYNEARRQESAAIKIQSIHRGSKAKKSVSNMRKIHHKVEDRATEKFPSVHKWLASLPGDLSLYAETFMNNGFDTVSTFGEITRDQLSSIGITKLYHQNTIINATKQFRNENIATKKTIFLDSPATQMIQNRSFYSTHTRIDDIKCAVSLICEAEDKLTPDEVIRAHVQDDEFRIYQLTISFDELVAFANDESWEAVQNASTARDFCSASFGQLIAENLHLEIDPLDRRKHIIVLKSNAKDAQISFGKKKKRHLKEQRIKSVQKLKVQAENKS